MEFILINMFEEVEVVGIFCSFPSYFWSGIFAVFPDMAVCCFVHLNNIYYLSLRIVPKQTSCRIIHGREIRLETTVNRPNDTPIKEVPVIIADHGVKYHKS